MQDNYWDRSTQPLTCLCFLAPLILLYEGGAYWLSTDTARNGIDVWLRSLLSNLGLGQHFLLPLLVCATLLGWHHLSRRRWTFDAETLVRMALESLLFGIAIVAIARIYTVAANNTTVAADPMVATIQAPTKIPHLLSYLGAGIYEELLFRFMLLSTMIWIFCQFGVDARSSALAAIVATSVLFAAAHYAMFCGVGGDFNWYTFLFRFLAGGLFSILFLFRGFGIVVGAHAAYDMIAASLNV